MAVLVATNIVVTDDVVVADALTVTGATTLNGIVAAGNATTDTIGFYGTTAISQRASSDQSTSLIISNSIGTAAEKVMEEICNTLTALGLWKGAA